MKQVFACQEDYRGNSGDIISRLVFQSFKPVYSFSAELFYSMEGMSDASLELNLELLKALKRKDQAASGKAMGHILKFAEKKV